MTKTLRTTVSACGQTFRRRPLALCVLAAVFLGAGCATEDPGIRSRQDQALKDPFSYGPSAPQDPRKKPAPVQAPPSDIHTPGN